VDFYHNFNYSCVFFKTWDMAMLLMCQHRKTCNYYRKGTSRKQKSRHFNGCSGFHRKL